MELKYKVKTTKMHKKITEDVIKLEHKDNGEKANIIFNSLLHTKCQNKDDNIYVEEKVKKIVINGVSFYKIQNVSINGFEIHINGNTWIGFDRIVSLYIEYNTLECVDIKFNGRIDNDDGYEIDVKTSNF